LPAVATPSEIMCAVELGYDCFKFFPAVAYGGVAALKAISGPFPDIRFCPTGGLRIEDASAYLALPNVLCVGGTWLAPVELIARKDWGRIEQIARETVEQLRRPLS
jgi:2-dehydro-3-deoxyphosphogluconate aldolase/(4S)-4-hydroxy-2-oxoglutarate aldolase